MDNENISIIIPVYNVEKWIDRCLMSIQRQSYKKFEVLLIDDGSNDNSSLICQKFVSKDSRFKYFKKSNGGLSDARNYGIDRANGNFIIFVDGDDYVESDYVKKLFFAITRNNADVAICGFSNVNADGSLINKNLLEVTDRKIISGIEAIKFSFNYQKSGWSLGCAWNKIYKASLFRSLRFEKGRYYEDGLLFPFLFLNVKKAVLIHEALYDYVQRDSSIMHSKMTVKKIKDDDYSMNKWIQLFNGRNNELYRLSIQKYKDWIINKWVNNRKIILESGMDKYLQQQFRLYEKIEHSSNIKKNVRDMLAFMNLNLLFYLYKLN